MIGATRFRPGEKATMVEARLASLARQEDRPDIGATRWVPTAKAIASSSRSSATPWRRSVVSSTILHAAAIELRANAWVVLHGGTLPCMRYGGCPRPSLPSRGRDFRSPHLSARRVIAPTSSSGSPSRWPISTAR